MENAATKNIKSKFQSVINNPMGALLCILTVNAVIWALALFFGVHWDESDDSMIALMLRNSDYYCMYIGWGVRWFVHQLFLLSSSVEWWMIFSIAISALGISFCVYSVIRKYPNKRGFVLGGILLLIGWFVSVYSVNFTRTAMMISIGGVSLILLALTEESHRNSIFKVTLGLFFLIIGGQIRVTVGYLALGFLALGGFIYLIRQKELLKKSWWFKNCKAIVILLVSAVAFIGMIYLDTGIKTDGQKEIDSYNAVRANIQDYSGSYSGLLQSDELCSSIGLSSSNDMTMLINWMNDDSEVFTEEQLTKIYENKDENNFIGTAMSAAKQTVKIFVMSQLGVLLLIVAAITLFVSFKKNVFPISLVFLITAALLFYLCFRGRNPARVYDSIIFAAVFTILFFSDYSRLRVSPYCVAEILLAILFIAVVWVKTPEVKKVTPFNEIEIQNKLSYANYDLINEKKNNVYIDASFIYDELIGASVWTVPPEDYCDNLIPAGGWSIYASVIIDQKEKYGIENPLRDLLEKENTYLIFDKEKMLKLDKCEKVLNYLREHYDSSAVMETVNDIGAFSVVRYKSGN